MQPMMDKAKTGFIDYVNPRLKVFDKPLFLAILIFIHTMIVCFIMWVVNMTACDEIQVQNIVPNTCSMYEYMDVQMAEQGNLCIRSLSVLDVRDGIPGSTVTRGRTGTQPCYTSPGYEEKWCSAETEAEVKEYIQNHGGYGECPWCEPGLPRGRQDINVVMTLVQKTCMTPAASLGAALGYAGIIEFFFTVCYVTVLMKTGRVSMKNGGYLGAWVRQVVKDSGGEVVKLKEVVPTETIVEPFQAEPE